MDEVIRIATQVVGGDQLIKYQQDIAKAKDEILKLGISLDDIKNKTGNWAQALPHLNAITKAQKDMASTAQQMGSAFERLASKPMFMMSLAQGIEDASYSWKYAINNSAMVAMQAGQAFGLTADKAMLLAAKVNMAAVAISMLTQYGPAMWKALTGGEDEALSLLESINKQMDELQKKKQHGNLTGMERITLESLKEQKDKIEGADRAQKKIEEQQTKGEREGASAVEDVLVERRARDRISNYVSSRTEQLTGGDEEVRDEKLAALERKLKSAQESQEAAKRSEKGNYGFGAGQPGSSPFSDEDIKGIRDQIAVREEEISKEVSREISGPLDDIQKLTGSKLRDAMVNLAKKLREAGDEEGAGRVQGDIHYMNLSQKERDERGRLRSAPAGSAAAEHDAARERTYSATTAAELAQQKYGEDSTQYKEARDIAEKTKDENQKIYDITSKMAREMEEHGNLLHGHRRQQELLSESWAEYRNAVERFGRDSQQAMDALVMAQNVQATVVQEAVEEERRARRSRVNDWQNGIESGRGREEQKRQSMMASTSGAIKGQVQRMVRRGEQVTPQKLRGMFPELDHAAATRLIDEAQNAEAVRPIQQAEERRQAKDSRDAEQLMGPARMMGLGRAMRQMHEGGMSLDDAEKSLRGQLMKQFPGLSPEAAEQMTSQTRGEYENFEGTAANQRALMGPLADPRVRLRAMMAGEFGREGIAEAQMAMKQQKYEDQMANQEQAAYQKQQKQQWARFGKYVDPAWQLQQAEGQQEANKVQKDPVVAMNDLGTQVQELAGQMKQITDRGIDAHIVIA